MRRQRDPVRWRAGFFKAATNLVEEMPDTVMADLDPALVQVRQQFAPGDIRLLRDADPYRRLFMGQRERLLAAHRQRRGTADLGHASLDHASGPADRR